MITETSIAVGFARLLQPLIKDIYEGAKKAGARGLLKWEHRNFPTKLARRIKSIENVRTLWKPEPISLREFFHPPKVFINDKPDFLGKLSQLPANNIIIEGIVGQGKSILLRSLAIEEILSNAAKRLPLFLELKDLSAKLELRQAIIKQLECYDIEVDEDSVNYLYKSGKISLLLDGFDEIEESLVKNTYLEIEHLTLRFPELQIVITSRPNREIQKSPLFKTIKIAQLTSSEYPAFLLKLGVSSEKSLSLRTAIKNSPSKISNLINTPLMLTLVVIVYEAESEIPETLPEFFDRLFQTVFSRHDRIKAAFTRKHHCGLSERALQSLFESFCFMTLQLGYGRTLNQSQFDEIFDLAIDYSDNAKCASEDFKKDITKVACLMLEDGIDSITFLHKSILEYYAAAFIRRLSEDNAKKFYEMAIESGTEWQEVLIFLKSIDTFRHAKNFLIPAIKNERNKIPLSTPDDQSQTIIDLINNLYPELGAYFRIDPIDNSCAIVSAYGSLIERSSDRLGGLGFLLMDALGETIPNPISNEELHNRFGAYPEQSHSGHGAHIRLQLIIQAFGDKHIRRAFGIFNSRLAHLETDALSVIAKEEKKKIIFDKKPRST